MEKHRQNIDPLALNRLQWLADQIFKAFPDDVSGLKFFVLDCGCIYYHRVFPDGTLDTKTGIYRDAEDGPCEICMTEGETWKEKHWKIY